MNILLDTNILLWLLDETEKLPVDVATLLANPDHDVFFSSVNIWEIAIKAALGKPAFLHKPATILAMALDIGYVELPVGAAVAATVADLPLLHADPFDRLLVAQAMAMPARFYTADRRLGPYSELVTLVR